MTTHINLDPLEWQANANSLFFPTNNLIVSFHTREQSEAAYVNANKQAVLVVRLYGELNNGS